MKNFYSFRMLLTVAVFAFASLLGGVNAQNSETININDLAKAAGVASDQTPITSTLQGQCVKITGVEYDNNASLEAWGGVYFVKFQAGGQLEITTTRTITSIEFVWGGTKAEKGYVEFKDADGNKIDGQISELETYYAGGFTPSANIAKGTTFRMVVTNLHGSDKPLLSGLKFNYLAGEEGGGETPEPAVEPTITVTANSSNTNWSYDAETRTFSSVEFSDYANVKGIYLSFKLLCENMVKNAVFEFSDSELLYTNSTYTVADDNGIERPIFVDLHLVPQLTRTETMTIKLEKEDGTFVTETYTIKVNRPKAKPYSDICFYKDAECTEQLAYNEYPMVGSTFYAKETVYSRGYQGEDFTLIGSAENFDVAKFNGASFVDLTLAADNTFDLNVTNAAEEETIIFKLTPKVAGSLTLGFKITQEGVELRDDSKNIKCVAALITIGGVDKDGYLQCGNVTVGKEVTFDFTVKAEGTLTEAITFEKNFGAADVTFTPAQIESDNADLATGVKVTGKFTPTAVSESWGSSAYYNVKSTGTNEPQLAVKWMATEPVAEPELIITGVGYTESLVDKEDEIAQFAEKSGIFDLTATETFTLNVKVSGDVEVEEAYIGQCMATAQGVITINGKEVLNEETYEYLIFSAEEIAKLKSAEGLDLVFAVVDESKVNGFDFTFSTAYTDGTGNSTYITLKNGELTAPEITVTGENISAWPGTTPQFIISEEAIKVGESVTATVHVECAEKNLPEGNYYFQIGTTTDLEVYGITLNKYMMTAADINNGLDVTFTVEGIEDMVGDNMYQIIISNGAEALWTAQIMWQVAEGGVTPGDAGFEITSMTNSFAETAANKGEITFKAGETMVALNIKAKGFTAAAGMAYFESDTEGNVISINGSEVASTYPNANDLNGNGYDAIITVADADNLNGYTFYLAAQDAGGNEYRYDFTIKVAAEEQPTTCTITGQVVGTDNNPLEGVKADLYYGDIAETAYTDAAGTYRFENIAVDPYSTEASIWFTKYGYQGGSKSVDVAVGTVTAETQILPAVVVKKEFTVSGVVADAEGNPLKDVEVAVLTSVKNDLKKTDAEGKFSFSFEVDNDVTTLAGTAKFTLAGYVEQTKEFTYNGTDNVDLGNITLVAVEQPKTPTITIDNATVTVAGEFEAGADVEATFTVKAADLKGAITFAAEGVTFDPATIAADAEGLATGVAVKATFKAAATEGENTITITVASEGADSKIVTVKYTVKKAVKPAVDDVVMNANVWAADGMLFIESDVQATATVYTVAGQAVRTLVLSEGVNAVELPTAMYVVKVNDSIVKIAVK